MTQIAQQTKFEWALKYFADIDEYFNALGDDEKAKWRSTADYLHKVKFFEAPASSKYHLSVRGGLLIHSVNVCYIADRLRIHLFKSTDISLRKMYIAGILHDVGKCGILHNGTHYPFYVENKTGYYPYKVCQLPINFQVRDLSPIIISQLGWDLEIANAVLLHDGAYVEANKLYSHKYNPLAMLLMLADTFSCQYLESENDIADLPF